MSDESRSESRAHKHTALVASSCVAPFANQFLSSPGTQLRRRTRKGETQQSRGTPQRLEDLCESTPLDSTSGIIKKKKIVLTHPGLSSVGFGFTWLFHTCFFLFFFSQRFVSFRVSTFRRDRRGVGERGGERGGEAERRGGQGRRGGGGRKENPRSV